MVEVKDQTEDDLPEEEINYEEDEFEVKWLWESHGGHMQVT